MKKGVMMIPCRRLRSASLRKSLLAICLLSLVGLLFTHKDHIVNNLHPRWMGYYNSINNGFKETDEQSGTTLQHSTKLLQPKATTTSSLPKPIENLKQSSMGTRKTKTIIPKLQNGFIKPLNYSMMSRYGAKPQNASTPKSMTQPTKMSQVSTTFDYLGMKYATDETHVNSKCPNRIRDKLRSKEFKDMFLEKIPVLQWKKHAQKSEYERLKKYIGAQGWMSVSWEIINETLNLLNSTGNAYMFDTWRGHSPCIRCAVVGTGGILNGSRMGQEIDLHDYVFRVNGAIIKGFEKDVGNRTSFFSFSTNTMMNSLNAYWSRGFTSVPRTPETRFILIPDHNRDYLIVQAALKKTIISQGGDQGKDPSFYFGKNLTTEHFKILHPDFMRYLRNRFLYDPILETHNRDIYRPSTGASMLLAAIHTCDQVSAYGFMTPNYGKFSDHYYDITHNAVAFYANHNLLKEMSLWQKLHNAGVIKLYMRE